MRVRDILLNVSVLTAFVLAGLQMASPQSVSADESSDKLDLILKELRSLSIRVGRLEAEVKTMQRSQRDASLNTGRSRNRSIRFEPLPKQRNVISPMLPPIQPREVMDLQQKSPNELMRNIHERERQLRSRVFPADSGVIN